MFASIAILMSMRAKARSVPLPGRGVLRPRTPVVMDAFKNKSPAACMMLYMEQ
jgi:hypothetical protein